MLFPGQGISPGLGPGTGTGTGGGGGASPGRKQAFFFFFRGQGDRRDFWHAWAAWVGTVSGVDKLQSDRGEGGFLFRSFSRLLAPCAQLEGKEHRRWVAKARSLGLWNGWRQDI